MKRILMVFLVVLCCCAYGAGAQAKDVSRSGIKPFQVGELYGYVNAKGEMVISPQYYSAAGFAPNGLAAVKVLAKDGKPEEMYYINTKGERAISLQFDSANSFTANGLAAVSKNGRKWGYINAKGETVIPFEYDLAGDFTANGLALVSKYDKYGYINAKGDIVIPIQYAHANGFTPNGLAKVRNSTDNKCGYINAKGKTVIPFQFDQASDFDANGLALAEKGDMKGKINAKGEWVKKAAMPGQSQANPQQQRQNWKTRFIGDWYGSGQKLREIKIECGDGSIKYIGEYADVSLYKRFYTKDGNSFLTLDEAARDFCR